MDDTLDVPPPMPRGRRGSQVFTEHMGNVVKTKEDMSKSKEQLEEEKRAILKQRIEPLSIDGLGLEALIQKARDIHSKIFSLESEKYDLEERFKRQQYDMMELAERARQMNKGKKKSTVATEPDKMADKYTGCPPKIQLCSKYERKTDGRSFGDRKTLFGKADRFSFFPCEQEASRGRQKLGPLPRRESRGFRPPAHAVKAHEEAAAAAAADEAKA